MDDRIKSRDYYRNLSTVSLFYSPGGKWNISNAFRYAPSFPNLSYLNGVDQKQDSHMIVRGNPAIKPLQTVSDPISFTYQGKTRGLFWISVCS